jgi:hypothetical protein
LEIQPMRTGSDRWASADNVRVVSITNKVKQDNFFFIAFGMPFASRLT